MSGILSSCLIGLKTHSTGGKDCLVLQLASFQELVKSQALEKNIYHHHFSIAH